MTLVACAGPRNAPNELYLRRLRAKADQARVRQDQAERELWAAEQQIRDDKAAVEGLRDDNFEAARARKRATLELAARLDSLASLEAQLVEARVSASQLDREFAALQRRIEGLKAAGPLLGEKAGEVRALEVWLAEARSRPVPEAATQKAAGSEPSASEAGAGADPGPGTGAEPGGKAGGQPKGGAGSGGGAGQKPGEPGK